MRTQTDDAASTIGEFSAWVITAILAAGENAYGVPIIEGVEELLGREVSSGAVYTTLDRLEVKGFITSWLGEPTKERGGKAKRYYRVEGAGEKALRNALRPMEKAIAVVAEWGARKVPALLMRSLQNKRSVVVWWTLGLAPVVLSLALLCVALGVAYGSFWIGALLYVGVHGVVALLIRYRHKILPMILGLSLKLTLIKLAFHLARGNFWIGNLLYMATCLFLGLLLPVMIRVFIQMMQVGPKEFLLSVFPEEWTGDLTQRYARKVDRVGIFWARLWYCMELIGVGRVVLIRQWNALVSARFKGSRRT